MYRQILMAIIGVLFIYQVSLSQTGEVPINPGLLPAVVKITAPSLKLSGKLSQGTGFIVSFQVIARRETTRENFLVTNKHIMSNWSPIDSIATQRVPYIDVTFPSKLLSQNAKPQTRRIPLLNTIGATSNGVFLEHTAANVDLCIVFLGHEITSDTSIWITSFDMNMLMPFDSICGWLFNIGSKVFILGYPDGVTSLRTSSPIAKSGYLASIPGEELAIKIKDTNSVGYLTSKVLQGKLLIVDGLIVKGNSGGPVILPSILKTRIDSSGGWQFWNKASDNFIIGILSGSLGESGLSYVYSSDYLVEAIESFANQRGWKFIPTIK